MAFRFSAGTLALLFVIGVFGSCSKNSPSNPTPTPTHASVSITSITVSGARATAGGFTYRTVLHLRETGGAAATIRFVDLTFSSGATTLTTSHFEQTIPATGNVTPANGVADTTELVSNDTASSHAFADTVVARVTYTDSTAIDLTVSGSAAVPPLSEPPPAQTYTLRGIITEQGTDRGIEGARVEAINGANNGKATLTDITGAYTLNGLVAETFRMRASATGFDPGEQNVTVPDITRADMALKRTAPAACAYAITPSGSTHVSFSGGQFAFTITRTSGTCAWQASTDVSWLSLGGTSGGGDASLTVTYQSNVLFLGRSGVITVQWTGGSAQLTVTQDPEPAFCRIVTITVNGQNPLAAPAAGGSFTANITPEAGTPSGACGSWTATATSGIALAAAGGPQVPGSLGFTVQANGSGTPRVLSISVTITGGPTIVLNVNQSGS